MSDRPPACPALRRIRLADIEDGRRRAPRAAPRIRAALKMHIQRTGLYPPLIVRPHPNRRGKYEILDGRLRAAVLRELGLTSARCEVWPVDDDEADLCLATLNRLRAGQDVKAKARQTVRLLARYGEKAVRDMLAMTGAGLKQQRTILRRVGEFKPSAGALDLRPVVFHLPSENVRRLERVLRAAASPGRTRGQALLALLESAGGGRSNAHGAKKERNSTCRT